MTQWERLDVCFQVRETLGWSVASLWATQVAPDWTDKRLIQKQIYMSSSNLSVSVGYRRILSKMLHNINNQEEMGKVDADLTWPDQIQEFGWSLYWQQIFIFQYQCIDNVN